MLIPPLLVMHITPLPTGEGLGVGLFLFFHSLHSLQRLLYLLVLGAQTDSYVSLSVASEDESRSDEHPCLVQHTLGEFFAVFILLGNLSPKEHSHLIRIERTSEFGHYLLGNVAATTVGGDVSLAVPFGRIGVVSLGSCELYSTERTRVNVALYLQYPRDESGV